MRRLRRALPVFGLGALVAGLAAGATTSGAFAYGRADQPLAQVEVSGNCDNPQSPFCSAPPNGFGLGGIWFWVELDNDSSGDLKGAECMHSVNGGGPGSAGAISINQTVSWQYSPWVPGALQFGTDPHNSYYLMTMADGSQWLIPTTVGHYSWQPPFGPTNGVQLQMQVAP